MANRQVLSYADVANGKKVEDGFTEVMSGIDPEDKEIIWTSEMLQSKLHELTKMTEENPIKWLHSVPSGYEADFLEAVRRNLPTDGELEGTKYWRIDSNVKGHFDVFKTGAEGKYRKFSEYENFPHLRSCLNCHQTKVILSGDVLLTEGEECRFHDPGNMKVCPEREKEICLTCNPGIFDGPSESRPGWSVDKVCRTKPNHEWVEMQAGFWNEAFTLPPRDPNNPKIDVVAMDLEMVGCVQNNLDADEIITGSIVDCMTNDILLNDVVAPNGKITEYQDNITAITPALMDLAEKEKKVVRGLKGIQEKLCAIADQETIIVGWAIHNDLRCLKLAHNKILDLQVFDRMRRSSWSIRGLKYAAEENRIKIQTGTHGSLEDAYATAELCKIYMGSKNWAHEISTLDQRREQAVENRNAAIQADVKKKELLRLPPPQVKTGAELAAWQGSMWAKLRAGRPLVAGEDFQQMKEEDHPVQEVKR